MGSQIASIFDAGINGTRVDIECHISNGLPNIIIVGFGNKAVDEAKERIRSAFSEANIDLPRKRITLNLAPADMPKDGTGFDLPMAAAILLASKQIDDKKLTDSIVVGELGLDGSIRPVRGIIGKLISGKQLGFTSFYIPVGNLKQALLVPGITLIPVKGLRDFYLDQTDALALKRVSSGVTIEEGAEAYSVDFSDIVGQARAKRAMEIAAAGGHNILLNGPPGTGKSMLAKALPSILPPMTHEEVLEVTQLHSLASRQYETIVTKRPFRSPHHTASEVSILGGGQNPKPGEISLSHRGVLFFDELPEYNRSTLEALRQPLEDNLITVARAKDTYVFPANFMFVATANPCPCGHYGTSKNCTCSASEISKYQRKLSGPILDRVDLYVEVDDVEHAALLAKSNAETSDSTRGRVAKARSMQQKRYKKNNLSNADLNNEAIKRHSHLQPEAQELLNTAAEKLNLSARAYMRLIKVARTIADLNGTEEILPTDISEALQYRRQVHFL